MENLRVALVGAGAVAQNYFSVAGDPDVEVDFVAVVEPVHKHAEEAVHALSTASAKRGSTGEVALFDDIHSLIDAKDKLGLQGVIVCTPPITHVPIATASMDAGFPVLCEKPLAPNRPGLSMMHDAAARADVLLMMASKFRYAEDIARTKEFIDADELGNIVLFRNAFTSRVDMRNRWNSKRDVSGGGVIIDQGTHSVDIARFLLGSIRYVIATDTRHVQGLAVEDTAQMMFRTDSNAVGTVDLSWSLNTGSPWFLTVDGTAGSVRLGWDCAEINIGGGWKRFGDGFCEHTAFVRQLNDFANAVRHDKQPIISVEDVQASVAVVDAAYRSMETGAWVRVIEERRSAAR